MYLFVFLDCVGSFLAAHRLFSSVTSGIYFLVVVYGLLAVVASLVELQAHASEVVVLGLS